LALSYIRGLDVCERYASAFQQQRDGMDIYG